MSLPQIHVPAKITYAHEDGTKDVYIRHEQIGYGGFSVVYRVTHLNSNTDYAMKVISKKYIVSKGSIAAQMLKNEMKIQKSLNHPNIVNMKISFSDKSNRYIILEYCPGQSVREFLRKNVSGRLSEQETRRILLDVIQGLVYLHNKNIIHHDIKLENFLIGSDGKVKIADFGLSTVLSDQNEEEKSSAICGSANYFSPEIIQKEGIGFGADIWAIGVAAFIMLTGRPPFEGSRKEITFERIKNCDYQFPSTVFISSDAKDFIKTLIQIDPHKRPNAIELSEHPFLTLVDNEVIQLFNSAKSFQMPQKNHSNQNNDQNVFISSSKFSASTNNNQKLKINNASTPIRPTNNHLNASFQGKNSISLNNRTKFSERNALHPYKSSQLNIFSLDHKQNFTVPSNFVTQFCFHGEDLIYLIGNGTVGICFKDQSRIIMDPNEMFIHYYKDYDTLADIFDIQEYFKNINGNKKDKLQIKISLVRKYAKMLKRNISSKPIQYDEFDSFVPLFHVKYYIKNNDSILFKLNDRNIQVNFGDQKKLFIFANSKKMCLARGINEKCHLFDIHEVASMNSNCDEFIKFQNAKFMLSLLAKKI